MWKALLAGTTALTIVGASLVSAQQTPPTQPGRDAAQQRPRFTAEDRAALTDARIAALKAGLRLTSAQEKNWPAVEAALRDRAKQRAERFEQRRKRHEQRQQQKQGDASQPRRDMIDRMRSRADNMATAADSLKRLTEAVDPLYKSLDDGQKQRFAMLFRAGDRPRHHHFWFRSRDTAPGPGMGPAPRTPDRPGRAPRQRRSEIDL